MIEIPFYDLISFTELLLNVLYVSPVYDQIKQHSVQADHVLPLIIFTRNYVQNVQNVSVGVRRY